MAETSLATYPKKKLWKCPYIDEEDDFSKASVSFSFPRWEDLNAPDRPRSMLLKDGTGLGDCGGFEEAGETPIKLMN